MSKRIAVIGGGLSGLVIASELSTKYDVQVFEKARGVGGRMSTRYADPFYFDHGTQFFTARSEAFKDILAPLIAQGHVAEWSGKVITLEAGQKPMKNMWYEPHYVAAPNMNSLCKKLAEHCTVTANTEIAPLVERQHDGWHLSDKNGAALGVFDWVISTAPPVQTVRLFAGYMASEVGFANVRLLGCYTLMVGFNRPWDKSWIAAKVRDNPFQWVGVNSSKPQRNADITALVAHSDNQWAETHIDDDMAQAQVFLVQQFEAITGIDCSKPDYLSTHRWRYAITDEAKPQEPYIDAEKKLASSGDWCGASRIEDVWLSAKKLADYLASA